MAQLAVIAPKEIERPEPEEGVEQGKKYKSLSLKGPRVYIRACRGPCAGSRAGVPVAAGHASAPKYTS